MNTPVVDTNIFMSALIKEGFVREVIIKSGWNLLFPIYELEEIYNHKEEIMKKSGLDEKEFYVILLRLLKYVRVVPTDVVTPFRALAFGVIGHIDKDDAVFVATALAFNCSIWSDDKHFQKQKRVKVFTTKEIYSEYNYEND